MGRRIVCEECGEQVVELSKGRVWKKAVFLCRYCYSDKVTDTVKSADAFADVGDGCAPAAEPLGSMREVFGDILGGFK